MVSSKRIKQHLFLRNRINYIDRNYRLNASNSTINLNDFTDFSLRSYEIPYQLLTNVQVSDNIYFNVSFGLSHNIFASDVYSEGEEDYKFIQNTLKRRRIQMAMLANIGAEYRTEKDGIFYIWCFFAHRPWDEVEEFILNMIISMKVLPV